MDVSPARPSSGFGVGFASRSTVRLDLELFKFVARFACGVGVGVGVGALLSCACIPARAITIPSPEKTPGSFFTTSPLAFNCTSSLSLRDGNVD